MLRGAHVLKIPGVMLNGHFNASNNLSIFEEQI